MTIKPVAPRARARADVELAIDYYTSAAGADVAFAFIEALERVYTAIGGSPNIGSSRWSHELNLPGLRNMRLTGFPYIVFYIEIENQIDVWRVLHARRDITAWMRLPDDEA